MSKIPGRPVTYAIKGDDDDFAFRFIFQIVNFVTQDDCQNCHIGPDNLRGVAMGYLIWYLPVGSTLRRHFVFCPSSGIVWFVCGAAATTTTVTHLDNHNYYGHTSAAVSSTAVTTSVPRGEKASLSLSPPLTPSLYRELVLPPIVAHYKTHSYRSHTHRIISRLHPLKH